MNKKINGKQIIKAAAIIVVILVYIVGMIFLCKTILIDSDKSNHLLQAKDILSGNFWLSGWIMTGITFFTTDLLYYEIAYLIAGVSREAVYIACGLMISVMTIVSFWLIADIKDKNRYLRMILFILIMGVPSAYMLYNGRVHIGALVLCLLSFKIVHCLSEEKWETANKRKNIFMCLALYLIVMLASNGDKLAVLEGAIPILIFCCYRIIVNNKEVKQHIIIVTTTVAGVISGLLFEKVFFIIGKADPNAYLDTVKYSDISGWVDKLLSFTMEMMRFFTSDFSNDLLGNKWSLIKFIAFVLLLVAVIVWMRIIVLFILRRANNIDSISLMLSISVLISFALYFFTSNSLARYISIIPFALIIILLRNVDCIISGFQNEKVWKVILIMVAGVYFVGNIHGHNFSNMKLESERDKVIEYLEENNLTNGYASFWNGSVFTIDSNEKIKVRHVEIQNNEMKIFNWFCKEEWYKQYANFIIICDQNLTERNQFNVSEETVTELLGEPIHREVIAGYIIYIYDYNISDFM